MKYLNFANSMTPNSVPEFLITLVDLSPSMEEDDWKPTRLAGATKANRQLIRAKKTLHPQDMVGIIGFYGKAVMLHGPVKLADGTGDLIAALKEPAGGGSTNFTSALELAESCFLDKTKSNSNAGRKTLPKMIAGFFYESQGQTGVMNSTLNKGNCLRRIIMLSDGGHNCGGSPGAVASHLKSSGVIIDCIGIGGSPKDVDEELLKEIASCNPDGSVRYCFIGDQAQLLRKYENLAHHIRAI